MIHFLANTDILRKLWRCRRPVSILNIINSTLDKVPVLSLQCDKRIIRRLDDSVCLSACENILTAALLEYRYAFTSSYGSRRFCVCFPNKIFILFLPWQCCTHASWTLLLQTCTVCFKEQLRFTPGSLTVLPPTISGQNMIKSNLRDAQRNVCTAAPGH